MAKKFKFPLENVLNYRKNLENIAQVEFQNQLEVLSIEMKKLEEMKEQAHLAFNERFEIERQGGKTTPALSQVDEFLKGQDIRIERQQAKIQEIERRVEELREILRQKVIDYKIIEELQTKQLESFKLEQRKKEQKENDELNTMRFRYMKEVK